MASEEEIQDRNEQIADRYTEGGLVADICREFKCSPETITAVLAEMGVPKRTRAQSAQMWQAAMGKAAPVILPEFVGPPDVPCGWVKGEKVRLKLPRNARTCRLCRQETYLDRCLTPGCNSVPSDIVSTIEFFGLQEEDVEYVR